MRAAAERCRFGAGNGTGIAERRLARRAKALLFLVYRRYVHPGSGAACPAAGNGVRRATHRNSFVKREPLLNVPTVVAVLLALFALIHVVRSYVLTEPQDVEVLLSFAFIPARYDSTVLTQGWPGGFGADIWTFVTYSFLHANWMHFGVNAIWFLPFGSAVARRFGTLRFLAFFAVTSAAGAALHLATHAGDRVELLAYDRRVRARVADSTGRRVLPAFAEALAGVQPELVEADWPGIVAQVRERTTQRALVVLLTALDPAAVEQGLLDVATQLSERHAVVLASLLDPEEDEMGRTRATTADLFDAAAAERTALERAAMAQRLRRRGLDVVEALPDDLAPRLADTYLTLKAAGRL